MDKISVQQQKQPHVDIYSGAVVALVWQWTGIFLGTEATIFMFLYEESSLLRCLGDITYNIDFDILCLEWHYNPVYTASVSWYMRP